jgi:hypothetical protein
MGRQTVDQSQLFYLSTSKNRFQRIISYAGSIQSSRGCWSIFARSWRRSTATSGFAIAARDLTMPPNGWNLADHV